MDTSDSSTGYQSDKYCLYTRVSIESASKETFQAVGLLNPYCQILTI